MRTFILFALLMPALLTGCRSSPESRSPRPVTPENADGTTLPGEDPVTGSPAPGTPAPGVSLLPCDVEAVVQARCGMCHGPVPKFGGMMSLMTAADWHKAAISDPDETVVHLAKERINYQFTGLRLHNPIGPMPPAPNPRLEGAELQTINGWIDAGAPARQGGVCTAATPARGAPASGSSAPPPDPAGTGTGGGAGTSAQCPGEEVRFLAHAPGVRDTRYKVGVAKDAYVNFTFRSPWKGTVYANDFIPVIDNDEALHHWLLFKKDNSAGGDLQVKPSSGTHPDGQLVHGWAPGGRPQPLGNGVAMPLEEGFYTLELHYNSTDAAAEDASGVAVCISKEKPRHLADLSWLGTDRIRNTRQASGTCRPTAQAGRPITIVAVSPHMHTHGRHMRAVINRAAGGTDILHDAPFSFDSQVSYPKNIVLQPGDTITTTCQWDTEVNFGRGTLDEMCYLFTVAWPAGALRDDGAVKIHGPNSCMGGLF